jgi:hypothetical protein
MVHNLQQFDIATLVNAVVTSELSTLLCHEEKRGWTNVGDS